MNRKIKIAHVVGGLHSGGVEAVIYNYFSHMDRAQFEIHIISNSPSVAECENQFRGLGCIIHVLPERRKDFFGNLKQTCALFRSNRFDILHVHMNLNCFYHTFLGMVYRIPVRIAHSHLVEFPSGALQKAVAGIKKWLTRRTATDYFACGESAGIYLFGKRLFRKGKVHILKNAITVDKFSYQKPVRDLLRSSLGLNHSFCIGHVGRFTGQKNHTMILDIFSKIHDKRPDSELLLIGAGELEPAMKEKAASLNLISHVHFLGVKTDVWQYYQAMDAFLFPSTYEGLGIVLVEAQAASLPCFCSDAVPREAKVSDLLSFLPLDLPASAWADFMLEYSYKERISRADEIAAAGYDIRTAAAGLQQWYEKRTGKETIQ